MQTTITFGNQAEVRQALERVQELPHLNARGHEPLKAFYTEASRRLAGETMSTEEILHLLTRIVDELIEDNEDNIVTATTSGSLHEVARRATVALSLQATESAEQVHS